MAGINWHLGRHKETDSFRRLDGADNVPILD
jgi:hypothetical protein